MIVYLALGDGPVGMQEGDTFPLLNGPRHIHLGAIGHNSAT